MDVMELTSIVSCGSFVAVVNLACKRAEIPPSEFLHTVATPP